MRILLADSADFCRFCAYVGFIVGSSLCTLPPMGGQGSVTYHILCCRILQSCNAAMQFNLALQKGRKNTLHQLLRLEAGG